MGHAGAAVCICISYECACPRMHLPRGAPDNRAAHSCKYVRLHTENVLKLLHFTAATSLCFFFSLSLSLWTVLSAKFSVVVRKILRGCLQNFTCCSQNGRKIFCLEFAEFYWHMST